ncbi:MAG: hypothetical protein KJO21_12370 [Verrucomicrobiae bacterium]|nr:hypothetical protein [Verrucomicrobiae bacterium]NNJ44014.1 glycosyltransferase family 4 protein [Akkermansiaceae bacterium]
MRILITEEALQDGGGHWPSYIGGIAEGMREAGDEVDVLMHQDATPELVREIQGVPYLSRNCWVDESSQGGLGGIRHNLILRDELSRWLSTHEPYDWVCCLTMRLQHLLAMAMLSRSGKIPSQTRFLMLFVQGFGQYAGLGKPTVFPHNLSTYLARFCFRLLAPAVRSGRVVLAAETKGMQDELQRFTGLSISLFPHPVPPPAVSTLKPHDLETSQSQPACNRLGENESSESRVTITCPGFARHEKGNDLLQQAIRLILACPAGDGYRFVMQWPEPFEMPDGAMLGPDPELLADERVEFLNGSLNAEEYEQLLDRSDLVVLPYRCESYHHRLSRVAIEAASRGIPLIYSKGTWTSEVADLVGGGVEIEDESPEGIKEAILTAVNTLDRLRMTAESGSKGVTDFHSGSHFRKLMENRG